jgi:hypothetical protein
MTHHQAARDKWNGILSSAKAQPVTDPPATLKATFDGLLARASDADGLARLALQLEQIVSDTYLAAIPVLQSKDAVTLAGQLQVVDQEHIAILHYILGGYPSPNSFQNTDKAFNG